MNRVAAYKLLTDRLQYFAVDPGRVTDDLLEQGESVVGEDGKTYFLTYKLKAKTLEASVHDGNNAKFEILEEHVVLL